MLCFLIMFFFKVPNVVKFCKYCTKEKICVLFFGGAVILFTEDILKIILVDSCIVIIFDLKLCFKVCTLRYFIKNNTLLNISFQKKIVMHHYNWSNVWPSSRILDLKITWHLVLLRRPRCVLFKIIKLLWPVITCWLLG